MKRFLLCWLLVGCVQPSLISLPPSPPGHAGNPFVSPSIATQQGPDPELVSLCHQLQTEHDAMLTELQMEQQADVRAVLRKAVTKAETGLESCKKEGAL